MRVSRSGDAVDRALGFAIHVVAGEALERAARRAVDRLLGELRLVVRFGPADDLGVRLFLEVHHAVFEVEHLLPAEVAEDILGEAVDERGHALAGGIVVERRLQEVGELGVGVVVLLGAVDGVEGDVLPDVVADRDAGADGLGVGGKLALHLAHAVGPEGLPDEQLGMAQQDAPELDVVAVARDACLRGRSRT